MKMFVATWGIPKYGISENEAIKFASVFFDKWSLYEEVGLHPDIFEKMKDTITELGVGKKVVFSDLIMPEQLIIERVF